MSKDKKESPKKKQEDELLNKLAKKVKDSPKKKIFMDEPDDKNALASWEESINKTSN